MSAYVALGVISVGIGAVAVGGAVVYAYRRYQHVTDYEPRPEVRSR